MWIETAISFVLGACIGSFLNVCIHRLPAHESIVSPPSHCPKCGHPIPWYLNVPLVSYAVLGGRCRFCKASISPVYPLVELGTGLLALIFHLRYGWSLGFFVYFGFACALIAVTFIDLEHRIIPNAISLPGILVGLAVSPLRADITWMDALLGALLGGGILLVVFFGYYLLTRREGMGLGDVKLLAMIGAFLGWKAVLFVLFASSLLGALAGMAIMVIRKGSMKLAIPFGPFLALGAFLYIFFGAPLTRWYLALY